MKFILLKTIKRGDFIFNSILEKIDIWGSFFGNLFNLYTVATFVLGFLLNNLLKKLYKEFMFFISKNKKNYQYGVLVVQVGSKSIETKVKQHIQNDGKFKYLDKNNFFVIDYIKKDDIKEKDLDKIQNLILNQINKMGEMGISKVSLFISSPLPIACQVGYALSNNAEVKVYHYNNGDYKLWNTLKKRI